MTTDNKNNRPPVSNGSINNIIIHILKLYCIHEPMYNQLDKTSSVIIIQNQKEQFLLKSDAISKRFNVTTSITSLTLIFAKRNDVLSLNFSRYIVRL